MGEQQCHLPTKERNLILFFFQSIFMLGTGTEWFCIGYIEFVVITGHGHRAVEEAGLNL